MVRRRIKALKKLQMEATNIEAKFYEEVGGLAKPNIIQGVFFDWSRPEKF